MKTEKRGEDREGNRDNFVHKGKKIVAGAQTNYGVIIGLGWRINLFVVSQMAKTDP